MVVFIFAYRYECDMAGTSCQVELPTLRVLKVDGLSFTSYLRLNKNLNIFFLGGGVFMCFSREVFSSFKFCPPEGSFQQVDRETGYFGVAARTSVEVKEVSVCPGFFVIFYWTILM